MLSKRFGTSPESRQSNTVKEGYFFDVDGTLAERKFGTVDQYELDADIAAVAVALLQAGERVIIFSGGDIREQRRKLHGLGIHQVFVDSKSHYRDQILDVVVDDEPNSGNYTARHYLAPHVLKQAVATGEYPSFIKVDHAAVLSIRESLLRDDSVSVRPGDPPTGPKPGLA
jgi:hypothetical protein